MRERIRKCLEWFAIKIATHSNEHVCATRDVFQARAEKTYSELLPYFQTEGELALFFAVVSEIGNNCFDHNLGQWQDIPGCWFDFGIDPQGAWACIADRGQGGYSSLKRVVPSLQNHQQALEMAFEKRISGRSLERRGNGLKFVRNVINGNRARGLIAKSGDGSIQFGGLADALPNVQDKPFDLKGKGMFAAIAWGKTL